MVLRWVPLALPVPSRARSANDVTGERYVYDDGGNTDPATGVALDDVALVFDLNGNLLHRYLHGPGIDQVFADEDAVGDILWPLTDHQGTVRDWADYDATTDTTTVTNHLEYDTFGNITAQSNTSHTPLYAYTGREWDADVDLQYNRHRWYDPAVGRWISEDPIGFFAGDTGLARYVGNSPIKYTDPSGLEIFEPTVIDSERELGVILSTVYQELHANLGHRPSHDEYLSALQAQFAGGGDESLGRSFYTNQLGFLDLRHVLAAYEQARSAPNWVVLEAGECLERGQAVRGSTSAWSVEDLVSNRFGTTLANETIETAPDLLTALLTLVAVEGGGIAAAPAPLEEFNQILNFGYRPVLSPDDNRIVEYEGQRFMPCGDPFNNLERIQHYLFWQGNNEGSSSSSNSSGANRGGVNGGVPTGGMPGGGRGRGGGLIYNQGP